MSMPNELAENLTRDVPRPPSSCRSSAKGCAEPCTNAESSRTQVRSGKGKAVDIDEACGDAIAKVDVVSAPEDGGPYGFFSKELTLERRQYILIVVRTTVLIILLTWLCLPVFWGALSDSAKLTSNLEAWFVNRDAARIGNTLWDSFSNTTAPGQYLGWISVDPADAGSDENIINAVVQNQVWIVVVVETNATTNLSRARANGDSSYEPQSAITVYYAQARQETAVGNYVLPITTQLLTTSITAWATGSAQRYFAQITPDDTVNQTAVSLLAQAPQTISPGIWWTTVNLRPYTSATAQAVTLVGNIFLIIFTFFSAIAHCTARSVIAPRLHFSSYMILRLAAPFLIYIPLSLSYALVSLAYNLPFGGKYSYGGGFMLTFVLVYLGMAASGLALEAMVTVLTPKYLPYFLFILIIFNVSPVILPPELMNSFYIYGTGFPIWNLSQAFRTILFNTCSQLGRNAGVMIAWIVLSCGTVLMFTWLLRRRELRTFVGVRAAHEAQLPLPTLSHLQEDKGDTDEKKCV